MLLRHICVFFLSVVSVSAWADALDINLSNDVAQFRYVAPMGHVGQGKSEFHVGLLYNNSNNVMGDVGIMVSNSDDRSSIATFGIGVKALAATIGKNNNAVGMALGGQVRFTPADDKKFGIVGQAYLAPDIVTFGDADKFVETAMRFEYEIMPQSVAYLGYRKTTFRLSAAPSVDVKLDEGIHIGVKIAF